MKIDGTAVHYVDKGQGPALILIHGAGGSSREWTFSMMDKLTDRFRVIAIDRPGHGLTGRIKNRSQAAETLKEQADLVTKLATRLEIDQAIIVGQSYGGGVALAMAIHHPNLLSGLVVVSGLSNLWESGLDPWYLTADTFWGKWVVIPIISLLITRAKAEKAVAGIFAPDLPPEGYLAHMSLRLSSRPSQIRANMEQISRSYEDIEAQVDRYGEIDIPVEIIHGSKDTTVSPDVHSVPLATQIKGANLTILEDVGHMSQQIGEKDVIAAIDRVASRATKPTSL
ncbi:MAG: alpha/beta hydrolase [Litoreibacter sp.]